MFTLQLSKSQGEAGIALVMAVFVTLFLLAISLAYIVCSKNSLNQSHLSQGKVKGVVVAEAGMERALWYLQERADANESITAGSMPEFGSYTQLLENYRNMDEAREYGIIIPGMGTNTRYAVMTADEEDGILNGTVTNGREIAIYVLGVTRQANVMGMSVSNIKAMKTLVRIGARVAGMPEMVFGGDGEISLSNNAKVQINGNLYSRQGIVVDASSIDTLIGATGSSTTQSLLTADSNDTWLKYTRAVLEGPWTNSISEINDNTNSVNVTRGSCDTKEMPVFNIAKFATRTAQGTYNGPDYFYSDLRAKNWTFNATDNVIVNPADKIMTICHTQPSQQNDLLDVFYDINYDGYTVIYLGPNDPSLRIMPGPGTALLISSDARGIIASQGKGTNFYNNNGIGLSTYDSKNIGADLQRNDNVGVEIRGKIKGEPRTNEVKKEVYIYNPNDINTPQLGYAQNGTNTINPVVQWDFVQSRNVNEYMGQNWGALSIIAENDVIISETGDCFMEAQSTVYDTTSAFRGFVYSKRDLNIQTDILFQGMMIGCRNAQLKDHGSAGWGLAGYGDGWDTSLYYEDPLNPSGGLSFFPAEMAPSSSVANSREMTILSWEADKFYKL
ncbi:MAG: hypothetical protein ABH886_08260 [Candidatus Desantisbacteria bacterium]